MKQKNKKGFTLIELLAVIVILGIIAVIAVPVVKSITKDAKMKSFTNTARGIIRAGDLYYSKKDMMDEIDGEIVFEFPDNVSGLEINGKLPEEGKMIINEDGDIALAITNGKYCVTKSFEDVDLTITDDYEECVILGGNTESAVTLSSLATTSTEVTSIPACLDDGTTCAAGTPVAIKVNATEVYNFYVISETNNKITLIMDRNIYAQGNTTEGDIEWINETDYVKANADDNTTCGATACSDEGPITAVAALKERTSGWTNIPEREYTYSDDGGANRYSGLTETMRARMLTYTEAKILANDSNTIPTWLCINLYATGDNKTYGYWLSAAHAGANNYVYQIGRVTNQYLISSSSASEANFSGVRPVIELAK